MVGVLATSMSPSPSSRQGCYMIKEISIVVFALLLVIGGIIMLEESKPLYENCIDNCAIEAYSDYSSDYSSIYHCLRNENNWHCSFGCWSNLAYWEMEFSHIIKFIKSECGKRNARLSLQSGECYFNIKYIFIAIICCTSIPFFT